MTPLHQDLLALREDLTHRFVKADHAKHGAADDVEAARMEGVAGAYATVRLFLDDLLRTHGLPITTVNDP